MDYQYFNFMHPSALVPRTSKARRYIEFVRVYMRLSELTNKIDLQTDIGTKLVNSLTK